MSLFSERDVERLICARERGEARREREARRRIIVRVLLICAAIAFASLAGRWTAGWRPL